MAGSDLLGEIGKGELLREEELNTAEGGRNHTINYLMPYSTMCIV